MAWLRQKAVLLFFVVALLANGAFWAQARHIEKLWDNVPPAPSKDAAASIGLGDSQLAYRIYGTMLQNMGDSGGRTVSLNDYDFKRLAAWFFVAHHLDPHSDFVPFLAAYYFGAVSDASHLPPLIDYLVTAGQVPEREKWRWLAHAVFLARHGLEDLDLALEYANILAGLKVEGMPLWPRQMPALIQAARGDKETAYQIMVGILKSSAEDLHPAEVNYMVDYICTNLLDERAAKNHPLCQ